jgi:hypothetical protein
MQQSKKLDDLTGDTIDASDLYVSMKSRSPRT